MQHLIDSLIKKSKKNPSLNNLSSPRWVTVQSKTEVQLSKSIEVNRNRKTELCSGLYRRLPSAHSPNLLFKHLWYLAIQVEKVSWKISSLTKNHTLAELQLLNIPDSSMCLPTLSGSFCTTGKFMDQYSSHQEQISKQQHGRQTLLLERSLLNPHGKPPPLSHYFCFSFPLVKLSSYKALT